MALMLGVVKEEKEGEKEEMVKVVSIPASAYDRLSSAAIGPFSNISL